MATSETNGGDVAAVGRQERGVRLGSPSRMSAVPGLSDPGVDLPGIDSQWLGLGGFYGNLSRSGRCHFWTLAA